VEAAKFFGRAIAVFELNSDVHAKSAQSKVIKCVEWLRIRSGLQPM
jgi:hypothetical protein